jgi:hypothetical protein
MARQGAWPGRGTGFHRGRARGRRRVLEPLPSSSRARVGGRPPLSDEEAILRRIRTRSIEIAAAGAVAGLFFGWRAAVSLTIAAAVVIFSFLVLEKLTERLVPPQEKKGFRAVLPLLLVTVAGAAVLGIALLRWRGFEPVAGMAGLSVVVLAIGAELLTGRKG